MSRKRDANGRFLKKQETNDNLDPKKKGADPQTSTDSGTFEQSAREEMYANYDKHRGEGEPEDSYADGIAVSPEVEPETPEAAPAEAAPAAEAAPEVKDPPAEDVIAKPAEKPEEAKPAPAAEKSDYVKEVKKPEEQKQGEKEIKTVPLAALRESRDETKAIRKELTSKDGAIEKLTEQVNQLTQQVQNMNPEFASDDGTAQPDSPAIKKLENKIAGLEQVNANRTATDIDIENAAAIDRVDKKLVAAGKLGFKTFATKYMKFHFEDWQKRDPVAAEAHDTEEGWEIVFLEHFLPDLQVMATQNDKKDHLDEKNERKAKAGLITAPGGNANPEVKPEQIKSTGKRAEYDEFIQNRRTQLL